MARRCMWRAIGGGRLKGGVDACAGVWLGERQNAEFHRGDVIMEMVSVEILDIEKELMFGRVMLADMSAVFE
jgi:hypothetical protein